MTNEILQLDDIVIDNSLNPREGALDQEVILDYAAHADGLPPMHVFQEDQDNRFYLVSGFHRIAAHRLAGRTAASFIVHVGTLEEAKEFADLDNLKHGLRLSRAERRAVIERQLKRHPDWSDARLALACSTSDKTVRTVREELEANLGIPRFDVLVGSDGIARPRTVSPLAGLQQPQPGFENVEEFKDAVLSILEAGGFAEATLADAVAEPGQTVLYEHTASAWRWISGTSEECYLCDRGAGSGVYHHKENYHLCFRCYGRHRDAINTSFSIGETLADLKDLAELERLEAEERAPAEADAGLLAEADTPPDPAELRKQLHRALHCFGGAEDRWAERRERGLTNAELGEAIGNEFGDGGASGPGDPGYSSKGGRDPRLWLGPSWQSGKPALQGVALRDAARELLEIPYPSSRQEGGEIPGVEEEAIPLQPGEEAIQESGFTDPPLPPVVSAPFLGPAPTETTAPPAIRKVPLSLNITFYDAATSPVVSVYRGPDRLWLLPRDIAERAHALIEEMTEPEPAQLVEPEEETPEAAPEWRDTFTVKNGE